MAHIKLKIKAKTFYGLREICVYFTNLIPMLH